MADAAGGGGGGGVILDAPVPVIWGDSTVGSTLVVDPGTWDNTDLTFQWFSCDAAIVDATSDSYVIANSDASCLISVEVTGTLNGQADVVLSSDLFQVDEGITPITEPLPVGFFGYSIVGKTLVADASYWPQAISLDYQWLLDGEAIDGATSSSYLVRASDAGHSISVSVTGAPDGINVLTGFSNTFDVALAEQTLTPVPVMKGTFKVGKTLTVTTGLWMPGVQLSYQWFIDNDAVFGATNATFELPGAAVDLDVYVEVTGTLDGYNPSVQQSEAATVSAGALKKTATPTITGTAKVGQKLTAVEHVWDQGVTFEYQWLASGKPIVGATDKTFVLTGAQLAKNISVKITGSLLGYISVAKTSVGTAKVALGEMKLSPVPLIVGKATAGKSVSVNCGAWVLGTTFKIVWLLDGKPIKKATGLSLKLDKKAKGHKLSVSVTGSAVGYKPVTRASKVVKVS
jgi:hypothetical protein